MAEDKKRIRRLTEENRGLREKLRNKNDAHARAIADIRQRAIRDNNAQIQRTRQDMQRAIDTLTNTNKSQSERIEELRREQESLQREEERNKEARKREESDRVKEVQEALQKQLDDAKKEIADAKKKAADAQREQQEAARAATRGAAEVGRLTKALADKEREHENRLQSATTTAEHKDRETNRKLSEAQSALERARLQVERLQGEINTIKASSEAMTRSLADKLREANKSRRISQEKLEQADKKGKEDIKEALDGFKSVAQAVADALKGKDGAAEAEQIVQLVERAVQRNAARQEKANRKIEKEKQKVRDDYELEKKALERKLKAAEDKITEKEKEQKDEEIARLNSKIKDIQNENEIAQEQKDRQIQTAKRESDSKILELEAAHSKKINDLKDAHAKALSDLADDSEAKLQAAVAREVAKERKSIEDELTDLLESPLDISGNSSVAKKVKSIVDKVSTDVGAKKDAVIEEQKRKVVEAKNEADTARAQVTRLEKEIADVKKKAADDLEEAERAKDAAVEATETLAEAEKGTAVEKAKQAAKKEAEEEAERKAQRIKTETDNKIRALEEDKARLERKEESSRKSYIELSEDVLNLQKRVHEVSQKLDEEKEKTRTAINEKVRDLTNKLAEEQTKVTDAARKYTNDTGELQAQLEKAKSKAKKKKDELKALKTKTDEEIKQLENSIKAEKDKAKTDLETAKATTKDIENKLKQAKEDLRKKEKDLKEANKAVKEAKAEKTATDRTISQLEADKTKLASDQAVEAQKNSNNQQEIARLRAELEEAKKERKADTDRRIREAIESTRKSVEAEKALELAQKVNELTSKHQGELTQKDRERLAEIAARAEEARKYNAAIAEKEADANRKLQQALDASQRASNAKLEKKVRELKEEQDREIKSALENEKEERTRRKIAKKLNELKKRRPPEQQYIVGSQQRSFSMPSETEEDSMQDVVVVPERKKESLAKPEQLSKKRIRDEALYSDDETDADDEPPVVAIPKSAPPEIIHSDTEVMQSETEAEDSETEAEMDDEFGEVVRLTRTKRRMIPIEADSETEAEDEGVQKLLDSLPVQVIIPPQSRNPEAEAAVKAMANKTPDIPDSKVIALNVNRAIIPGGRAKKSFAAGLVTMNQKRKEMMEKERRDHLKAMAAVLLNTMTPSSKANSAEDKKDIERVTKEIDEEIGDLFMAKKSITENTETAAKALAGEEEDKDTLIISSGKKRKVVIDEDTDDYIPMPVYTGVTEGDIDSLAQMDATLGDGFGTDSLPLLTNEDISTYVELMDTAINEGILIQGNNDAIAQISEEAMADAKLVSAEGHLYARIGNIKYDITGHERVRKEGNYIFVDGKKRMRTYWKDTPPPETEEQRARRLKRHDLGNMLREQARKERVEMNDLKLRGNDFWLPDVISSREVLGVTDEGDSFYPAAEQIVDITKNGRLYLHNVMRLFVSTAYSYRQSANRSYLDDPQEVIENVRATFNSLITKTVSWLNSNQFVLPNGRTTKEMTRSDPRYSMALYYMTTSGNQREFLTMPTGIECITVMLLSGALAMPSVIGYNETEMVVINKIARRTTELMLLDATGTHAFPKIAPFLSDMGLNQENYTAYLGLGMLDLIRATQTSSLSNARDAVYYTSNYFDSRLSMCSERLMTEYPVIESNLQSQEFTYAVKPIPSLTTIYSLNVKSTAQMLKGELDLNVFEDRIAVESFTNSMITEIVSTNWKLSEEEAKAKVTERGAYLQKTLDTLNAARELARYYSSLALRHNIEIYNKKHPSKALVDMMPVWRPMIYSTRKAVKYGGTTANEDLQDLDDTDDSVTKEDIFEIIKSYVRKTTAAQIGMDDKEKIRFGANEGALATPMIVQALSVIKGGNMKSIGVKLKDQQHLAARANRAYNDSLQKYKNNPALTPEASEEVQKLLQLQENAVYRHEAAARVYERAKREKLSSNARKNLKFSDILNWTTKIDDPPEIQMKIRALAAADFEEYTKALDQRGARSTRRTSALLPESYSQAGPAPVSNNNNNNNLF